MNLGYKFELRGRPAWVKFRSRYQDQSDYDVTGLDLSAAAREYDDGRVEARHGLTQAEAELAVSVYREHEAREYAEWREANKHLFV
jgi:hypothetical protein